MEQKNIIYLLGIILPLIILIGIIFIIVEQSCDSYSTESWCFDKTFRCEVECKSYDWNYQGNIIGNCGCDCGEYVVSFCSGFAWKKE